MKKLLLIASLLVAAPAVATEKITINANKYCAAAVGIPYASDNFSDWEWEQFQYCLKTLNLYKVH